MIYFFRHFQLGHLQNEDALFLSCQESAIKKVLNDWALSIKDIVNVIWQFHFIESLLRSQFSCCNFNSYILAFIANELQRPFWFWVYYHDIIQLSLQYEWQKWLYHYFFSISSMPTNNITLWLMTSNILYHIHR